MAPQGPNKRMAPKKKEKCRHTQCKPLVQRIRGAGGSIGVGRVARTGLDGYMLSIGNVQTHVFNAVTQKLQYEVVKDFAPVSLIADTPFSIVARSTLPAKDLKEFRGWLSAL